MEALVKTRVTVHRQLAPNANRYARSRGVSFSRLVANAPPEMRGDDALLFSQRWRGRFHPAEREDENDRTLAEKLLRA
jgi:hypothetical protein